MPVNYHKSAKKGLPLSKKVMRAEKDIKIEELEREVHDLKAIIHTLEEDTEKKESAERLINEVEKMYNPHLHGWAYKAQIDYTVRKMNEILAIFIGCKYEGPECSCNMPSPDDDNECCRVCGELLYEEEQT
jgi:hypothetical protein